MKGGIFMNGYETIEEILGEDVDNDISAEEWDNVHSQTWHDSWRNSH